jgi:hypothetical protein
MSEKYQITIDDKTIIIKKIDMNEYEFIMDYHYLQYYGQSFLKELKLNKFGDYLNYYEQKEEIDLYEINGGFQLNLPIPFTYEFVEIKLKLQENITSLQEKYIELSNDLENKDEQFKDLLSDIKQKNKEINKLYHQQKHLQQRIEEMYICILNRAHIMEGLEAEVKICNNKIKELNKTIAEQNDIIAKQNIKNKIHVSCRFSFQETYIMIDGVKISNVDINYSPMFYENNITEIIDKIQQYKNIRLINGDFSIIQQQYFNTWSCQLQFIKAQPLKIGKGDNYINIGIYKDFGQGHDNTSFKLYYE